jgi:hypothetical protein
MKLFRIWQEVNTGYDTYSDAVVAAKDADAARLIHPNGHDLDDNKEPPNYPYGTWCESKDVRVEEIGTAKQGMKSCVICASFHAG